MDPEDDFGYICDNSVRVARHLFGSAFSSTYLGFQECDHAPVIVKQYFESPPGREVLLEISLFRRAKPRLPQVPQMLHDWREENGKYIVVLAWPQSFAGQECVIEPQINHPSFGGLSANRVVEILRGTQELLKKLHKSQLAFGQSLQAALISHTLHHCDEVGPMLFCELTGVTKVPPESMDTATAQEAKAFRRFLRVVFPQWKDVVSIVKNQPAMSNESDREFVRLMNNFDPELPRSERVGRSQSIFDIVFDAEPWGAFRTWKGT
jgi:hypothetical protein